MKIQKYSPSYLQYLYIMYKSLNKFGPIVSLLALSAVPILAWKKNFTSYEKIRQRISQPSVDYELTRHDSSYPWANQMEQWEGRKIKMEGYFEEERFLISREKDGKKGYIVLAPFVYKQDKITSLTRGGRSYRQFVIVNVGWIPLHLKDSISMNYDQTELIEYNEQNHPGFLQIDDGFDRNPESETNYMPLTYITGIIRKGETKDVTRGLNNWPSKHYFRMIDLPYIARTFRLPNMYGASQAYVQLIAESPEERENIPIPNTIQQISHEYSASKIPYFKWIRENILSPTLEVVGKVIV